MTIPRATTALVLRTDYSDESSWKSICAAIRAPSVFKANVEFFSDPAYARATTEQLIQQVPDTHTFIFVVDAITVQHAEHPVLVIDLFAEPGRTFRVIPSSMWSVENNLSIGNMDFEEFADNAGPDGVFRGF